MTPREVVLPPVDLDPEELARRLVTPMPRPPYKVIAHRADKPLKIGAIEIPCFVLENEERVLSQRGVATSIGGSEGSSLGGAAEIPRFIRGKWVLPFIHKDLMLRLKSPIPFTNPEGGGMAYGFPAAVLPELCGSIMEAHRQGGTTSRQEAIVERASVLLRGFATVGIIALVDEATGYEKIRAERSLAAILNEFLSKELQPWVRTFPFEFYEWIYRLRGWGEAPKNGRFPGIIAHYTIDFVYTRLAPGIYDEVTARTPRLPSGQLKYHLHQWFTPEHGHPKVKERIAAVIGLMRSADDWQDFKKRLNRAYQKYGDVRQLTIDLEQKAQRDLPGT